MTLAQAKKQGVQVSDTDNSVVLTITASNPDGQRFISQDMLRANEPKTQLQRVAAYLSTFITVPFIPTALMDPAADSNTLDQLIHECKNPEEPMAIWTKHVINNMLEPIALPIKEDLQAPPTVTTSIVAAIKWEQILCQPSKALISRSPQLNSQSIDERVSILLTFPNIIVRNLVISHVNQYVACKKNHELKQIYEQNMARATAAQSNSDGFIIKLTKRSKFASDAWTKIRHLQQPFLPSFDHMDHGLKEITPMPSSIFQLNIAIRPYQPRFVKFRIDGLEITSSGLPYVQRKGHPEPLNVDQALDALEYFLFYDPALCSSETSITLPMAQDARRQAHGTVFLTTSVGNISLVKSMVRYWRANQKKHPYKLDKIVVSQPMDRIRVCAHCNQLGHTVNLCPKLVNEVARPLHRLCPRCNQPDAKEHDCIPISLVKCTLCKLAGHITGQCHLANRSWAQVAQGGRAQPTQMVSTLAEPRTERATVTQTVSSSTAPASQAASMTEPAARANSAVRDPLIIAYEARIAKQEQLIAQLTQSVKNMQEQMQSQLSQSIEKMQERMFAQFSQMMQNQMTNMMSMMAQMANKQSSVPSMIPGMTPVNMSAPSIAMQNMPWQGQSMTSQLPLHTVQSGMTYPYSYARTPNLTVPSMPMQNIGIPGIAMTDGSMPSVSSDSLALMSAAAMMSQMPAFTQLPVNHLHPLAHVNEPSRS